MGFGWLKIRYVLQEKKKKRDLVNKNQICFANDKKNKK